MRILIVTLLFAITLVLANYGKHLMAVTNPCKAVDTLCTDKEKSGRQTLMCGAEMFTQMFKKPAYPGCMRTWLDLHDIDNPTIDNWLKELQEKK